MKYELPKNKDDFIERYKLKERFFKKDTNQYYIRNYSGLNNKIDLKNDISNYLDNGNINVPHDWERSLQFMIENFEKRYCFAETVLQNGNFSSEAKVIDKTYVEDEKNGEKIITEISSGSSPLYSKFGETIEQFIDTYGKLFFNYLGTEEKLFMSKIQRKYGLNDNNTNFLSEVQFNYKLLEKMADYTKKMFNIDIYLDRYTWGDKILFRVGDDFNFIRKSERDDNNAEILLNKQRMLDDEGDGIKNFVTSYLALNLNDKNIILLDEPESFLHPPLANQLGEIIGESATDEKQIFISTHSVNLLKGILKSCEDINIIRITRDGKFNKIMNLDEKYLKSILSNPLLLSSNVLNGLFCEKVYISESETDEEFYQALHDKVNLLDSAFFVHGDNKQTLKNIADIYNKLEIKNYRIYDFDILKDEAFNTALNNFIPKEIKDSYIKLKKEINVLILDKDDYAKLGIRCIEIEKIQEKLNAMLEDLKNNGVIILKHGCLETNLEDMGLNYTKNNKKNWFSRAIKLIYDLPEEKIKNTYIYKWIFE